MRPDKFFLLEYYFQMSGETIFIFVLVGVTAVLMASNRIRFDVIALLVVLALILSGVLTVPEALAGFGSSVVILVAALLVIGEMLDRTGVTAVVGEWILKKGGTNEIRLLVVIMFAAGLLGAVMSSTAVVAIFIPIVLRIAAETNLNASRLLMPMSYAALISGMLTLIATPPNLVVSEELKYAGYEEFGFFSFTLVGLAVLAVAILYMVLIGRKLLPAPDKKLVKSSTRRSLLVLWEEYRADSEYTLVRLTQASQLIGKTIGDADIEHRYKLRLIGIARKKADSGKNVILPTVDTRLKVNDILIIVGQKTDINIFSEKEKLINTVETKKDRQRWFWELGGASVLIHPESKLIGKSIRELEFQSNYNLQVLGIRRDRKPLEDYANVKLASSDSLLVVGAWFEVQQLSTYRHDFVMLEMPIEHSQIVPAYRRMPVALIILAAMVLLTIFDVVPLVAAVLIACLAAGITRCLTMEDSYRAIHWSSIVLIAGMLPLADALEKTGGTQVIVDLLMEGVGDAGPRVMFTVIFFLTAALGLFLSNTASAVLVAPIAIIAAETLGVSPYAFAVAVLIAASAAFMTPVSTPVVTLVVDPGRYGFMDFVKVGVPLLLLAFFATLIVAPILFPFYPS